MSYSAPGPSHQLPTTVVRLPVAVLTAALFAGCMTWNPGWEAPSVPNASQAEPVALAHAEHLYRRADDRESLIEATAAFERSLALSPDDYDVLVRLSETRILDGAAYASRRREKAAAYREGIRYAERAMATNPSFRERVEAGATVGGAVSELGQREIKAMLLWVTGVSYYFKECQSGLGHVVNFRWMRRTQEVMEHMMTVDPGFENGAVPFSLGIYYVGLPPSVGGDLDRAEELMARAVEESGSHLLPRWGRAKYLHLKTGDREAFQRDLEWVLAQNPGESDSPYAWNVYFQNDAKAMLSSIDRHF